MVMPVRSSFAPVRPHPRRTKSDRPLAQADGQVGVVGVGHLPRRRAPAAAARATCPAALGLAMDGGDGGSPPRSASPRSPARRPAHGPKPAGIGAPSVEASPDISGEPRPLDKCAVPPALGRGQERIVDRRAPRARRARARPSRRTAPRSPPPTAEPADCRDEGGHGGVLVVGSMQAADGLPSRLWRGRGREGVRKQKNISTRDAEPPTRTLSDQRNNYDSIAVHARARELRSDLPEPLRIAVRRRRCCRPSVLRKRA